MPSRTKGAAGVWSVIGVPKKEYSCFSSSYDSPRFGRKSMLNDLNARKKEVMLTGYFTFK